MNLKKIFLLNLKKLVWVIVIWIASVLLHNLIYGLFGIEEAVFFTIASIGVPLYCIISLIYSFIYLIRMKKTRINKSKKKK